MAGKLRNVESCMSVFGCCCSRVHIRATKPVPWYGLRCPYVNCDSRFSYGVKRQVRAAYHQSALPTGCRVDDVMSQVTAMRFVELMQVCVVLELQLGLGLGLGLELEIGRPYWSKGVGRMPVP